MSAVNRGLRSASRSLRLQQRTGLQSAARPLTVASSQTLLNAARRSAVSSSTSHNFSTMSSLKSGAPVAPSEHRGYDPEITDIASYVHNKPIDSDLAVSLVMFREKKATPQVDPQLTVDDNSSTQHAGSSLTRSAAVSRASDSRNARSC